jgi:anti-sigma regulatory factor (Ser/Thr protein kinase)
MSRIRRGRASIRAERNSAGDVRHDLTQRVSTLTAVSAPAPLRGEDSAAWTLELPRSTRAPSIARRAIRRWHGNVLTEEELLRAVLLASELVSNAVTHGAGAITMRSQRDQARLRVDVIDRGGGFGHRVGAAPLAQSRRSGLAIVDLFASRWGVETDSSIVWFELDGAGAVAPRIRLVTPEQRSA